MKQQHLHLILICLWLVASGCNQETQRQWEAKPTALGKLNEIVLITGDDLAESAIRDTFDYYFGSSYPIMPSPEPMFDIRHYTVKELRYEPLRQQLRTYVILADISDADSDATKMLIQDLGKERLRDAQAGQLTSSVGKDKWARNQLLIYLFADGREALARLIAEKYSAVAKRINQHDKEQLAAGIYAIKNINPGLSNRIAEEIGVEIDVPGVYQVALDKLDENLIWLRHDGKEHISNIVVTRHNYTGPEMLTKEGLTKLRDLHGKSHVQGGSPGSYMVTNTTNLPIYHEVTSIDDNYAVEMRGIWEMTDDFTGGPYITMAIVNEAEQSLLLLDGFVLAPSRPKRKYIQELEYIFERARVK
jgi:hypothetical protein